MINHDNHMWDETIVQCPQLLAGAIT